MLFLPAAAIYVWLFRGLVTLRFGQPWFLLTVPIGVTLILWLGTRRSRLAFLVHSRASELGRHRPGLVARLRDVPLVLRLFAVALLGLALARPQTSSREDNLDLEGIDIVVTLDLSGSMEERDLAPNRLQAAKAVIADFVRRRPSDRIGLVIFGREAYTYAPLTLDHGTLLRMVAELRSGIVDGRGTAIGNGLGVALARLRKSDARSKVVILLTDGDNNAGNISPIQAATFAQKLGVKIYTILAGARGSAAEEDDRGGARYPVNPKLLEEIASMTGGAPYLATDTAALVKRFQSILEDLEKSRIKDRSVLWAELFPSFLWPAFAALLLETLLRLGRWRRLP
ncbi:MAG: VWA domain-containing protein [Deltaproteobacteria bacterium]|nr:VWA domain-containing protein [Deltaproteobacteria bacterium]